MRIFLVLHPSGNLSVPGSITWYKNFYEPLLDLDHDVFFLDMSKFAKDSNIRFRGTGFKEKFSHKLLEEFDKENDKNPFDLFLSYFTINDVEETALSELKKYGVPLANFSCNNTHQFYLVKDISKHYDFNLFSEKEAKNKFDEIGVNSIWFPMAANPKYYNKIDLKKKYDVSFVGSSYAKRAEYIYHLLENNIDVHSFGPNWLINNPHSSLKLIKKELQRFIKSSNSVFTFLKEKRFALSSEIRRYDLQTYLRYKYKPFMHYPPTDDEMINIYNSSKINLGFLEVFANDNDSHSTVTQHIHLREFEIPMSGNLYCTNYSEELAEFYEPDKEILVFSNEHELLKKVKYYLKNERVADKISAAGRERSLKDHTYQKRFQDLFNKLGIS